MFRNRNAVESFERLESRLSRRRNLNEFLDGYLKETHPPSQQTLWASELQRNKFKFK